MPDLDRETILNMEAGPEFDALVAEMMGWSIEHHDGKPPHFHRTSEKSHWVWLADWSPSTDPATDYEVLVFVRENWETKQQDMFRMSIDDIWNERMDFSISFVIGGYYYQPGDYSRAALLTTLEAKGTKDA